jgi:hypothetical protein
LLQYVVPIEAGGTVIDIAVASSQISVARRSQRVEAFLATGYRLLAAKKSAIVFGR